MMGLIGEKSCNLAAVFFKTILAINVDVGGL
jgi:hypothetical protein